MSALSTTLYELFADNLIDGRDKVAIVDGDASITYAELGSQIDALADRLTALGIQPGDRVVVQLRKSIAEVAAIFAIAKVGAVVVDISAQWTIGQLRHVVQDCRARVLIVEPIQAQALAAGPYPEGVTRVIVPGSWPLGNGYEGWIAPDVSDERPGVARLDTDLAMIIYTSGSSGAPKGVMLSHRNIVAGARSVARYLRLGNDERLLSVLPYSFDYGLNQLTTMMLMGGTVVHQRVAMATELISTMERFDVTGVAAVPPLWGQMVRLLTDRPTRFPALRRITNSGGKIALNILDRMPAAFPGVDIYLMYGLTEAFRSTYLAPADFARKPGSIGRAIPGAEIFVVKADGEIAEPDEQGELVHRGPLVSMGYWGQPEASRAKIRPCPALAERIGDEPVVYSGDIVRVDADGDHWFVGRIDAMIKTSGYRVSPDEIEDLVSQSGMVADVVAFGRDDEELGQLVHVALTPLAHYDARALMQHCRRIMPPYMIPRVVHLWHQPMPRTSSGKLARPQIVRESGPGIAATAPC